MSICVSYKVEDFAGKKFYSPHALMMELVHLDCDEELQFPLAEQTVTILVKLSTHNEVTIKLQIHSDQETTFDDTE